MPDIPRFGLKEIAVAVLLAALAIAPLVIVHNQFHRYEASIARVETLYQQQLAAERLLSTVRSAEAGHRGFLITGRAGYLASYERALTRLERELDALEAALSDDAEHRADIAEIRTLAAIELKEMEHTIRLRRTEGFEAAQAVVLQDTGREAMLRLRLLLEGVFDATRMALSYEDRLAEQAAARHLAIWLAASALLMGLLGVTVVLLVLERRKICCLSRRLAYDANHDELTGLLNRRAFVGALEATIARAQGHHRVGLLYIDLDGFKAVNDELGHGVGDAVLAAVARGLREAAGADALVGRLGGDEFAVVVPELSEEGALAALSDRLKAATDRALVAGHRVGLSIGAASYPEAGPNAAALTAAADAAMYACKVRRQGGGRGPSLDRRARLVSVPVPAAQDTGTAQP